MSGSVPHLPAKGQQRTRFAGPTTYAPPAQAPLGVQVGSKCSALARLARTGPKKARTRAPTISNLSRGRTRSTPLLRHRVRCSPPSCTTRRGSLPLPRAPRSISCCGAGGARRALRSPGAPPSAQRRVSSRTSAGERTRRGKSRLRGPDRRARPPPRAPRARCACAERARELHSDFGSSSSPRGGDAV